MVTRVSRIYKYIHIYVNFISRSLVNLCSTSRAIGPTCRWLLLSDVGGTCVPSGIYVHVSDKLQGLRVGAGEEEINMLRSKSQGWSVSARL